jgi:DNA-binding GntR family transcriptional regulator
VGTPTFADEGQGLIRRAPTFTEQVYAYLLGEIVRGALPPGERLVEQAIADKLSLSKTPVREAIARLARDGLVTITPQKGAEVQRFTEKEVEDLMELRTVLEGFAAEKAAPRFTEEDTRDLELLVDQMAEAYHEGDLERYRAADLEFHERILAKADNALLSDVLGRIRNQIALVMATSAMEPGRPEASVSEHRAIIEAIRSGMAARTRDEAKAHLLASTAAARAGFARRQSGGTERAAERGGP